MARQAYNANFLRTALTDYFNTVGAQASRDTTTKDANSTASFKAVYGSGSQVTYDARGQSYFTTDVTWRRATATLRFNLTATPAANVNLFIVGGYGVAINTSGHLLLGSQDSGIIPSLNTWHTLEVITDRDWRGANKPSLLCRLDGGTAFQLDNDSLTIMATTPLWIGDNGSKVTGPACTIYYNHLSVVIDDSTTTRAAWLNNAKVEQDSRVPIANGANNDFTGVGDTTNKYANVDESPSNSLTDYNYGGAWSLTKKQGYTFTSVTYTPDTPRSFTVHNVFKAGDGLYNNSSFLHLVRDNSVDYTYSVSLAVSPSVFLESFIGYDARPGDSSDLTSTILNNVEGGMGLTSLTPNSGKSTFVTKAPATSDGPTYNSQWTSTGANKYGVLNDANTATYISSTTLDDKQSFGITFSPTPANVLTDIVSCYYQATNSNNSGSSNGFKVGCRIGGVDYLTDTEISIGAGSFRGSGWQSATPALRWGGSGLNPATGTYWTQSDITNAEWYVQHTTVAGTGIDINEFYIYPQVAASPINTATFMVVNSGDAPTTNGAVPTCALTGTVTASITEADIVTGGKTIILTLTNDTWVASGATFDAQRQNIINGIDSAQSEGTGWDAVVKAGLAVTAVVRTSDTVVTVTLSAFASYDITAQETITATIPATARTLGASLVASPTFTVDPVGGGTTTQPQIFMNPNSFMGPL